MIRDRQRVPVDQRLWRRTQLDPATGCINWTGGTSLKGYGRIRDDKRRILGAHRLAYELSKGPIPAGLVIDHLCRNPSCCNPDHLEAVTSAENTRRGLSGQKDARKTHCPKGHPYDETNTGKALKGGRYCRICKRAVWASWRARNPKTSGAKS